MFFLNGGSDAFVVALAPKEYTNSQGNSDSHTVTSTGTAVAPATLVFGTAPHAIEFTALEPVDSITMTVAIQQPAKDRDPRGHRGHRHKLWHPDRNLSQGQPDQWRPQLYRDPDRNGGQSGLFTGYGQPRHLLSGHLLYGEVADHGIHQAGRGGGSFRSDRLYPRVSGR